MVTLPIKIKINEPVPVYVFHSMATYLAWSAHKIRTSPTVPLIVKSNTGIYQVTDTIHRTRDTVYTCTYDTPQPHPNPHMNQYVAWAIPDRDSFTGTPYDINTI